MREITSMPVYIFFKYYVLYYSHDEETLHSFIPRLYLRYKKGPDLNLLAPPHPCTSKLIPEKPTQKRVKMFFTKKRLQFTMSNQEEQKSNGKKL